MSTQVDRFLEALRLELAGVRPVAFATAPPPTLTTPSVIVAPGDPFITPATQGLVEEQWHVLAAISLNTPDHGIREARNLSLRIRRAVSAIGGRWEQTSGLRLNVTDESIAIATNRVFLKYDPVAHLATPEET